MLPGFSSTTLLVVRFVALLVDHGTWRACGDLAADQGQRHWPPLWFRLIMPRYLILV